MSIENHPNINAAGLACAVTEAVIKYSRGNATGNRALTPKIRDMIVEFCVGTSTALDEQFGITPPK